ncbi:MAG: hypothetical protein QM698_00450 [Micropepsaceae bacterium]
MDFGLKDTDFVFRSFGFLFDSFGRTLKQMVLWGAPVVALNLWPFFDPDGAIADALRAQALYAATGRFAAGPTAIQWAMLLGISAFGIAAASGFAVQSHRHIIGHVKMPERSLWPSIAVYCGYTLLIALIGIFLGVLVALAIAIVAPAMPPALAQWIPVFVLIGFGLLALRVSLIFPSTSIGDREMTLSRSINMTGRSVWRMALAFLGFFLFLLIAGLILGWLVKLVIVDSSALAQVTARMILGQFVEFLGAALVTTYLSLVYAHKMGIGIPTPREWKERDAVLEAIKQADAAQPDTENEKGGSI